MRCSLFRQAERSPNQALLRNGTRQQVPAARLSQEEISMRVAAYARYSTAEQDKISIAAQLANVEALCGREGFTIVARFQDEARQGSDDNRPGYRALLAGLKRGDFEGIVADETSRITRSQAELHRLVAELRYRE